MGISGKEGEDCDDADDNNWLFGVGRRDVPFVRLYAENFAWIVSLNPEVDIFYSHFTTEVIET